MKYLLFLWIPVLFAACAAKKEVVKGYNEQDVKRLLKKLEGASRQVGRKLLGRPAMEGRCKIMCGPKDVYRLIYPTKDMNQFYLNLSLNTDQEVECVVFDFLPDQKRKQFIFSSYRFAKKCNQKEGEIVYLDTYKVQ